MSTHLRQREQPLHSAAEGSLAARVAKEMDHVHLDQTINHEHHG
jgi:hypothetical protein